MASRRNEKLQGQGQGEQLLKIRDKTKLVVYYSSRALGGMCRCPWSSYARVGREGEVQVDLESLHSSVHSLTSPLFHLTLCACSLARFSPRRTMGFPSAWNRMDASSAAWHRQRWQAKLELG